MATFLTPHKSSGQKQQSTPLSRLYSKLRMSFVSWSEQIIQFVPSGIVLSVLPILSVTVDLFVAHGWTAFVPT